MRSEAGSAAVQSTLDRLVLAQLHGSEDEMQVSVRGQTCSPSSLQVGRLGQAAASAALLHLANTF